MYLLRVIGMPFVGHSVNAPDIIVLSVCTMYVLVEFLNN